MKRNRNLFQYRWPNKTKKMDNQTWLNLRAEYIAEQAYQMTLLQQPQDKKTLKLIAESQERCKAYDTLIQSHAKEYTPCSTATPQMN